MFDAKSLSLPYIVAMLVASSVTADEDLAPRAIDIGLFHRRFKAGEAEMAKDIRKIADRMKTGTRVL